MDLVKSSFTSGHSLLLSCLSDTGSLKLPEPAWENVRKDSPELSLLKIKKSDT